MWLKIWKGASERWAMMKMFEIFHNADVVLSMKEPKIYIYIYKKRGV